MSYDKQNLERTTTKQKHGKNHNNQNRMNHNNNRKNHDETEDQYTPISSKNKRENKINQTEGAETVRRARTKGIITLGLFFPSRLLKPATSAPLD